MDTAARSSSPSSTASPRTVYRIGANGGAATVVRAAAAGTYVIGNAATATDILTTQTSQSGASAASGDPEDEHCRRRESCDAGPRAGAQRERSRDRRRREHLLHRPSVPDQPRRDDGPLPCCPHGSGHGDRDVLAGQRPAPERHRPHGRHKTLYVSNTDAARIRKYTVAESGTVALTAAEFITTTEDPDGVRGRQGRQRLGGRGLRRQRRVEVFDASASSSGGSSSQVSARPVLPLAAQTTRPYSSRPRTPTR